MKLLGCIVLAALSWSGAQDVGTSAAKTDFVFGGIKLLPGYVASPPSSISSAWTISKKDGVTIRYTGGNVANVIHDHVQDAKRDGSALWTKEQLFGSQKAEVAMTKDGRMLIHIAPFNFEAKVESVEQATDMLLMVLTYPAAVGEK
jgi:hypothetical protein